MTDPLDFGFDGDLEPGRLGPDEVDERLRRPTLSPHKRTTRLDSALADLESMAGELVPAARLMAGLRSGRDGEAAWLFGLGVADPFERIRATVGTAHRRAWQYAERISRRLEELAVADNFRVASLSLWQLHVALRQKFHDRPDKMAALNKTMFAYFDILGASAFTDAENLSDLILEQGAGLGRLNDLGFMWLEYLHQVGLPRSHRHFDDGWRMADLTGDAIVLVEEEAARFPDQAVVAALRQLVAPRLTSVALRRHRAGVRTTKRAAVAGVIELDAVDFFILQLAEVYATCFGRPVPRYLDTRPGRDNQRDKHFARFLEAAAGVCDVPVGSWETRIRHWRRFPIVVEYLGDLTRFAKAAASGTPLPFALDEDRHLVTSWVLQHAPAAVWAGG